MQDIYADPGILTFPLRLAMVASKASSVLKGVELGIPLDDKGKHSLRVLSDLVSHAAQGGEVLKSKSMASYSSEAMTAYRIVKEAKLPGAVEDDPATIVKLLKLFASDLRRLTKDKPTKLNREDLQEFSVILTKQSLRENVGSREIALQLG